MPPGDDDRGAPPDDDRRAPPPGDGEPSAEERPYDEAWGGRLLSALGRFGRWTGIVLGCLLLVAAAAVFTLTQTRLGRGVTSDFVEDRLQGAVAEGEVRVGRIVGGNLLTRVVVDSFVIDGPDGRPFVTLDSVRLAYDPTGFLRGNFAFRNLEVGSALIQLLQYDDGSWNFRRIFRGGDGEGGGTRLVFHDVHLRSGHVVVRQPYPASGITGEEREEAIREAIRGETIWRIERGEADEGFERVIEVRDMSARFPLLRLADPDQPMRIEVDRLTGEALAVSQPLPVRDFSGSVTFRDSVHTVIEEVRLPASRLSGEGWVVAGDTAQEYRFDLRGDPVGFPDLQWLPVPVPDVGGGPMDVVIRTEAGAPVAEVSEGDIEVRGTRIRGGFTLALPENPRFDSLDLRFTPLELGLVGRLMDRPALVGEGAFTGTLSGSGPIDRLRIDASGALHPPGPGAPSGFEAHGGVSLVEPYRFYSLRVRLRDFSPDWMRLAGREPQLDGRVSGTVVLDGIPSGRLGLEADLTHRGPAGTVSAVRGGGSVDLSGEAPAVDVSVSLEPLALGLLEPWFPDLGLVGSVRGTMAARGRFSDLEARADLQTPRGQLAFDGRFDLVSEVRTYDARVTARDIGLEQWAEQFPETQLAVTGSVEGRGTDPATLEATFDLRILPSTIAGARVDTSTVRFTLSEGLARVDTLAIDSDVGRVRGRGAFGLVEDRSGSLVLDVSVPSLAEWNRWLAAPPDSAPVEEDLFAVFDEPLRQEVAGDDAPADTLAGAVEARGVVFGNLDDFSLGGRVIGRDLVYDGYATDSLVARMDVADPETRDSLTLNATAWGLQAAGTRVDSVSGRLQRLGPDTASVRVAAVRDTSLALGIAGGVRWGDRYAAAIDSFRLEAGEHRLALDDASTLVYGDSGLVVRDLVLRGGNGELLRADGRIPRTGSGDFVLSLENLHLEELLALLPDPPDAGGTLDGRVRVQGTADAPRMEGTLRLADPSFGSARYPLLESDFRYDDRRVQGSVVLQGEAGPLVRVEGAVRADLALVEVPDRLPEDALDLQISADSLPLQVLELAVESLTGIRGSMRADVRVTGGPGDLGFEGEVALRGGAATVPDLGTRFTGIDGRAVLSGSEARLDSLVLRTGQQGRATVTGTLGLAEFTDPAFDLAIRASDLQAMDTREMSFDVDGELELAGSYRSPTLTGSARISDGEIQQEDILRRQEVVDLTDPEIYSLIDTTLVAERQLFQTAQNPFMRNLRVDMTLAVGPDLWVRSPTLDVEVAGEGLEVRMDRADDQLQVTGTLRLVRGTYVFELRGLTRQELRIASGTIEFVGTPGINPNLDITAVYRTRTPDGPVTITAHVGGTMEDYQLTLESDPPSLSESDRLCFLAVGAPCGYAAADPDVAQRLGTEVALGALGTGLSSAVVGDIGLADFFSLRTGGTGGRAADQGFFAGAELEVGKYLGNEFFVTYTQPLGGYGVSEVTVEWRFSEDWTLEARTGSILGRRVGFVPASSLEDLRTYGLFLFREWSF